MPRFASFAGFFVSAWSVSLKSPMTAFKGQTENARHFLQPTANAMGHRVIFLPSFRGTTRFPHRVGAFNQSLAHCRSRHRQFRLVAHARFIMLGVLKGSLRFNDGNGSIPLKKPADVTFPLKIDGRRSRNPPAIVDYARPARLILLDDISQARARFSTE
ncbi:MAG: hypothetical protein OEZ08_17980 [Betaproteobacteria bacterium]|nr:hypothetical protein [Betaproteobacteria bacterium]